jgi:DNA invertase Pin-like site-specific DNA recombinase
MTTANDSSGGRIRLIHRQRQALIYVRQSSPQQVKDNLESQGLQRGLRQRAIELGWRDPEIIEDDLGVSASGFADRPGFRRMLEEVMLRKVGIIFGIEVSRLSRTSKDWAHLFEVCGHFETLIADADQIYDLSLPNDRLVLGIRGTMSELELSVLRERMQRGLEAKAARGELRIQLPVGYVYNEREEIVFDADRRIQKAIEALFDQFDRHTSVRQLALWYRDTETLFPSRRSGSTCWDWRVPSTKTLNNLLVHPLYTGAYVWGRRRTEVVCREARLIKRVRHLQGFESARVLIRDHHAGYITWERLVANCAKISENRPRMVMDENRGAIREGLALLTGLLRCGHCGGRLRVRYIKKGATYYCNRNRERNARMHVRFTSGPLDECIGRELCVTLQPLGIEAAVKARELKEKEHAEAIESAQMQVEAAQYAADRAFEQFDRCDPKNRLVADTLEERWNQRLTELQKSRQKLRDVCEKPAPLTEQQIDRLEQLGRSFSEVWCSEVDPKLKKRLLRAAIHEVIVKDDTRRLEATIHWRGGAHTRVHVPVPRRYCTGDTNDHALLQELIEKLISHHSDREIARVLNLKKLTTPNDLRWTQDRVSAFRRKHRLTRDVPSDDDQEYLSMNAASALLGISHTALRELVRRGEVCATQVTEFAVWRVPRRALDSQRVQSLVNTLKRTGKLPAHASQGQLTLFEEDD